MGVFDKIRAGLAKTRASVAKQMEQVLQKSGKVNEELFEELEEVLVSSDVGVATSEYLIEKLRGWIKQAKIEDTDGVRIALKAVMAEELFSDVSLKLTPAPAVLLVIGVNGVGKTTTIGKLAAQLKAEGKTVLLGAADTFRAAAIDQLEIWANRADVDIIKQKEGSDPAAVVFDAVQAGKARGVDVVICDTAGRLHNKKNLMDELSKISRVIDREAPGAARENLLVLDATTGQNAVNQAKQFKEAAGLTGIILTKLDGTARGGVVFAIHHELGVPVKYIGVGEQIDDLQPFDSRAFVNALFEGADTDAGLPDA
ncbi:MAG: signal recognition particle-docking protein FtsY [Ethanoligenens sp.]